jgi:azurin
MIPRPFLFAVLTGALAWGPGAALAATESSGAPTAPPRTITIRSDDAMKFSVTRMEAKPGERLRIALVVTGTMPKSVMAHNVVVLKKGTNVQAFINASATARSTAYIAPGLASSVVAHTAMAGPGEVVDVVFTAPRVRGRYDYVCSFPGHYAAGMKGVLVVK